MSSVLLSAEAFRCAKKVALEFGVVEIRRLRNTCLMRKPVVSRRVRGYFNVVNIVHTSTDESRAANRVSKDMVNVLQISDTSTWTVRYPNGLSQL